MSKKNVQVLIGVSVLVALIVLAFCLMPKSCLGPKSSRNSGKIIRVDSARLDSIIRASNAKDQEIVFWMDSTNKIACERNTFRNALKNCWCPPQKKAYSKPKATSAPAPTYSPPPQTYIPAPAPKAQSEGDLSDEFLAVMNQPKGNNQSFPANAGQPVDVDMYKAKYIGPFGVTIADVGGIPYSAYYITDQAWRTGGYGSTVPVWSNGAPYQLNSNGFWVYIDKSPEGLVTIDNLNKKIFRWSIPMGKHPIQGFNMFMPHESIKLNGFTEYRERSSFPSAWPNGISWPGADPNAIDKGQGWEFRAMYTYYESRK